MAYIIRLLESKHQVSVATVFDEQKAHLMVMLLANFFKAKSINFKAMPVLSMADKQRVKVYLNVRRSGFQLIELLQTSGAIAEHRGSPVRQPCGDDWYQRYLKEGDLADIDLREIISELTPGIPQDATEMLTTPWADLLVSTVSAPIPATCNTELARLEADRYATYQICWLDSDRCASAVYFDPNKALLAYQALCTAKQTTPITPVNTHPCHTLLRWHVLGCQARGTVTTGTLVMLNKIYRNFNDCPSEMRRRFLANAAARRSKEVKAGWYQDYLTKGSLFSISQILADFRVHPDAPNDRERYIAYTNWRTLSAPAPSPGPQRIKL